MTYNNPVFVEQCKRRNKDFDALNTGWVPQKRIGEEEEEEEEELEEIEEDEDDDDMDEPDPEVLFNRENSRRNREDRNSSEDRPRRSRPERSERSNEEDTSKEDSEKADKKEDKAPEAPTPKKPEVSAEDILGDFDLDDDSSSSGEMSTRDKVHSAISNQTSDSKPKIKLNIDKTTIANNQKKKPMNIKINLKK